MPEFQDFLKHKYAYIAIGEFKSGQFAEAQKIYEKAVSTYTTGFKGAYLFQKPGTDEGIAVIMWENLEDMEANQNEAYENIMKEMTPLFAKPPETNFYELCSKIEPRENTK